METLMYPKEVKAKKDHRCDFCNGKIGERTIYIKSTHVYDGSVYDWKSHRHCNELANHYDMYEDCDEGLTGEGFCYSIDEIYSDMMYKLIGKDRASELGEVLRQLQHVNIHQKIGYVYREFKKNQEPDSSGLK